MRRTPTALFLLAIFVFVVSATVMIIHLAHRKLGSLDTDMEKDLFDISTHAFFATVSIVVLQSLAWGARRTADGRFAELFGMDLPSRQSGAILVHPYDISRLDPGSRLPPEDRMLFRIRSSRAHEYINKYDALGAFALARQFVELGLPEPEILTVDAAQSGMKDRFRIYMGAVNRPGILEVAADCPWMRIAAGPQADVSVGDVLELNSKLVTPLRDKGILDIQPTSDGFSRLVPHKGHSRDYAVILRHSDASRCVRFVLSGFTEHGTRAAAEHLATTWRDMWSAYVRRRPLSDGSGDFLIIIEGQVDAQPSSWRQVLAITPAETFAAAQQWSNAHPLNVLASAR